jgi:hypothetical protein
MGFFGGGGAAPANMGGATSSVAGTAGLVPAPAAGNSTRVLISDATFRDPPLVPSYKVTSSVFLVPRLFQSSTGNVAQVARVRYFSIGFLPSDGEINTIAYRTGGAPASSINVHVAIWKVASDGLPGDYVGGAVIASGTTGNTDISASLSPSLSVERGFYYFSVTPESLLNSFSGLSARGAEAMFFGNITTIAGAGRIPKYTATTYNQTTHETFSFTTDTTPAVGVRYA